MLHFYVASELAIWCFENMLGSLIRLIEILNLAAFDEITANIAATGGLDSLFFVVLFFSNVYHTAQDNY